MLLPLLLICGAAAAASIVTYGTDAGLARFSHGIQFIMLSRRLEWPLVILCLGLCLALLWIVISGKCRAGWLLGLAVVLALFVRNFSSLYRPSVRLVEAKTFVDVDHAGPFVSADEYVVGFHFSGKNYALPYHQLTAFPLQLLSDFDQRAIVVWSVTANAATVLPLDRQATPRDLEVVSTPAGSLLLFDRGLGQFIVGVTGQTVGRARPVGMGDPIAVQKISFRQWANAHPDGRVMAMAVAYGASIAPVRPALPFNSDAKAGRAVIVVATTQPAAIAAESVTAGPTSFTVGKTSVLLYRATTSDPIRAFDRQTQDDLFLTLTPPKHPDKKFPAGVLVDAESRSLWTAGGRAIAGPLKGTQLREVGVQDGLYWGVMKFWMPTLQWTEIR